MPIRPGQARTAVHTSSTVAGATMRATRTGYSPVTFDTANGAVAGVAVDAPENRPPAARAWTSTRRRWESRDGIERLGDGRGGGRCRARVSVTPARHAIPRRGDNGGMTEFRPTSSASPAAADPDTHVTTLANGARVLVLQLPHVDSVQISVFVRTGSRHESRTLNGISHVVEHMAFKGTHDRTCQQINLDAERLGADVNAHTDKDHTAYHMRGLARDATRFVRMLGDIVRNSTF